MTIESRTTFDVWQDLIYDEALSRAVFAGSYLALARARGYEADKIAVLDWFAAQPGMRWNVENLRFRAALETGAALCIHLPKTTRLLTKGDDDWLQDICYEYLSFYSWDALGHRRLTECERFGTYIRERIMRRRITPPYLEQVLELELAAIAVHKKTTELAKLGWPEPQKLTADQLAAKRPRRGLAQIVVEQPVDLRAFMIEDKPDKVDPKLESTIWFIHIAGPTKNQKLKVISEGVREVLLRCTGEHTTVELGERIEAELDLPCASVHRLISSWFEECIVVD